MLLCVGGPPRSGTELMRQILNRTASIHLAPETHVFGDLLSRLNCELRAVLAGCELETAIDYFRALSAAPYGQHGDLKGARIERAALLEMASSPSVAGLYEAFCRWHAQLAGIPSPVIWGDKTPRHVFTIDLILEQFPDSKFLAMVRDPRAVVLSYRDWQNRWFEGKALDLSQQQRIASEELRTRRSYHPFTISLLWRSAAQAGLTAASRHPERVRLVKFEDLIDKSEIEVRAICDWLGVEFNPATLQVGHLNSSFVGRKDGAGFDRASVDRWERGLTSDEKWVVENLAGPAFKKLGYRPSESSLRLTEGLKMSATFLPTLGSAIWANRGRRGSLVHFVKERLRHL